MTSKENDMPCADDLTLKPSFDEDAGIFESSIFEFEEKADEAVVEKFLEQGLSVEGASAELQLTIPIKLFKKRPSEQRGEKYSILISEREAEIIVDVLRKNIILSHKQAAGEEELILLRLLGELSSGARKNE